MPETTPVPDPTVLTTEQILREVENATKQFKAELTGLESLLNEKLQSVGIQFALIERQRVEQKSDTATAVQAALSAAKEAVTEQTAASEKSIMKSETATAEQLKQLSTTFTIAIQGVSDAFSDLKDRVVAIETRGAGGDRSQDRALQWQILFATTLGTVVLAIVVLAVNGKL